MVVVVVVVVVVTGGGGGVGDESFMVIRCFLIHIVCFGDWLGVCGYCIADLHCLTTDV